MCLFTDKKDVLNTKYSHNIVSMITFGQKNNQFEPYIEYFWFLVILDKIE